MSKFTYYSVEELAFTYWQYNANEKGYASKLITKDMYEFAKKELLKSIDELEKLCYSKKKVGDSIGFIKNKAIIG